MYVYTYIYVCCLILCAHTGCLIPSQQRNMNEVLINVDGFNLLIKQLALCSL